MHMNPSKQRGVINLYFSVFLTFSTVWTVGGLYFRDTQLCPAFCYVFKFLIANMGRHFENPCHRYFNYDANEKTSKCKIGECKTVLKGNHATNLQNHIRTRPKDIFPEFEKLKET